MKAIEEKHKLREENEKMPKRIVKEEEDDREAVAKGNFPKRMKDRIAKETRAQSKEYIAEFRKNKRIKGLGGQ